MAHYTPDPFACAGGPPAAENAVRIEARSGESIPSGRASLQLRHVGGVSDREAQQQTVNHL
jgi:hypothetical protein